MKSICIYKVINTNYNFYFIRFNLNFIKLKVYNYINYFNYITRLVL